MEASTRVGFTPLFGELGFTQAHPGEVAKMPRTDAQGGVSGKLRATWSTREPGLGNGRQAQGYLVAQRSWGGVGKIW